jgi:uncharacterized delta-60 repeat protein
MISKPISRNTRPCFLRSAVGIIMAGASLFAGVPAIDPTLNPKLLSANSGGNVATVNSAVRQVDGKLVIVGQFTAVNGVARLNIARLNADGSVDTGFDPNPNTTTSSLNGVLVQPDGKLVVYGRFANFRPNKTGATVPRQFLARLNEDGTVDESLNLELDGTVDSAALQADGKLIIGGVFNFVKGTPRFGIARILADGSLDAAFDPRPDGGANCVAVQPDGKILLGGDFTSLRPNQSALTTRLRIARLTAAGELDTGFDPAADSFVDSIAVQADGKILVGGRFSSFSPNGAVTPIPRERFARLNADGTVDTSVRADLSNDEGFPASVWSSIAQADGKFLIAGSFDEYRPQTLNVGASLARRGLLRFEAGGALDIGFDAKMNGKLFGVALQGDGGILPCGDFTKVAGSTRTGIARLQSGRVSQSLVVTGTTKVEWVRSGSAPLVSWALFEKSTDNGATWTALGAGTQVGMTPNWELTGLSLSANTAIRVRGAAPSGKDNGSSSLIQQVALAPEVGTDTASQTTPDSAVLSGFVSANGFATSCSFQYSTDITMATGVISVPAQAIPGDGINVMISKQVAGLAANTTYHFRIVAQSFAGQTEGGVASFTTPNTPPSASDDTVLLAKAVTSQITIDALANDIDPDGDTLTISLLTKPKNGTVILDGSAPGNKILYTPGPGYATSGSDTFSYSIIDGNGGSAKAKVSLTFSEFAMQAGQFAGQLTGAANSIEGTLALTLTKTGGFSAVLLIGGVKKTVKGVFDANGDFASADGLVNLHLDLSATTGGPGSFEITGTVSASAGGPVLTLSGANAAYTKSALPVESGDYTVLLAHPGNAPGGIGWATMTVGKGGKVEVAGKLSDGTTLTCAATLVGGSGTENVAHLSAVLAYPVKGTLSGEIVFDESQPGSDCAGVLRWTKPTQTKGTLYLGGFDIADLDFAAARYTAPSKGVRALAFENRAPNGTIALSDGGLGATIAKDLSLGTTNLVSITSANTELVTVKMNASKGTFSGSFIKLFPPAIKVAKVQFGGVIYQKVPRAAGYFLGPTASGAVEIEPAP